MRKQLSLPPCGELCANPLTVDLHAALQGLKESHDIALYEEGLSDDPTYRKLRCEGPGKFLGFLYPVCKISSVKVDVTTGSTSDQV